MSATVTLVYDPQTMEAKFEVEGVKGGGCTDITKALTQANEVTGHEVTAEYCEQAEHPDYVTQGE